jgi:hypothetical protein
MASASFKFKDVGKNVRCTGKLRLSCGHWINESVTASSKQAAEEQVKQFMRDRVNSHKCS